MGSNHSTEPTIAWEGRRRRRLLPELSDHSWGLLITVAGVVILSPDALLIRSISVDQWTILFWRGLLSAVGLGAILVASARSVGHRPLPFGRIGAVVAVSWTATTVLFVIAISHTGVANTLVIVSAAPLFTAVLSRVVLGEPVARRTWVAVLVALMGMGIIFSGSLELGGLPGDLAALGASVGIAVSFVAIRRARTVSMIPAVAMGNLLTALVMVPFARPLTPTAADAGLLVLNALLILPISASLVASAPRYIPAAEVKLVGLIETVLGPLWVWAILREGPSAQAVLAAAVIVPTLAVHSVLALGVGRGNERQATDLPAR